MHGEWGKARAAVEEKLEELIPRRTMEQQLSEAQFWADRKPEVVQRGSGWGALELHRRAQAGEKPFCGEGIVFDDESLGEQEAPWVALLEDGSMPDADPGKEPLGYLVQHQWRQQLEAATAGGRGANWWAWYHLGIMRYCAEYYEGARKAWEQSIEQTDTPWARRNLAVLDKEEGKLAAAAEQYATACRQRPGLLPLIWEGGNCLLEAEQSAELLQLIDGLPGEVQAQGRVKLLEGRAALAESDFARAGRIFEEKLVIDDLREGERSLSHLWFEYHEKRLSHEEGIEVDEALKERVREEFPVPQHLDFRMSAD